MISVQCTLSLGIDFWWISAGHTSSSLAIFIVALYKIVLLVIVDAACLAFLYVRVSINVLFRVLIQGAVLLTLFFLLSCTRHVIVSLIGRGLHPTIVSLDQILKALISKIYPYR